MKSPCESYIPSSLLTGDLPVIIFKLSYTQNGVDDKYFIEDDCVSISLLKRIGCRSFNIESLAKAKQNRVSTVNIKSYNGNMRELILQLIEERKNMSETDFKSIKESKFLTGTTLESFNKITETYAPHELHFPSVAVELNWSSLLIIDWPDIHPHSPEYTFLKEIGVREAPELNNLIDRMIRKHDNRIQTTKYGYKVSSELHFFAKHFHQHYSSEKDIGKYEQAFLPSTWPMKDNDSNNKTIESDIILLMPSKTFTDTSPICPTLLPEVTAMFRTHFLIKTLGIKEKPTAPEAFDCLINKRSELLHTTSSASKIFVYLNKLDGWDHAFVTSISKVAFIPLRDNGILAKPTDVFIRSANIDTSSMLTSFMSTDNKNKLKTNIDTGGLIDFVDFGREANSFLSKIGVLTHPTASILAELLLQRQASYFKDSINNQEELLKKQNVYLFCLKQLAQSNNLSNELSMGSLKQRLKHEPWCLGYQTIVGNDGKEVLIFKIVTPKEIYLNDDQTFATVLNELYSPEEQLLIDLYEKFGSQWLSDCCQRIYVHMGQTYSSKQTSMLHDTILNRFNMLFVDNRGIPMNNIDERKAHLLTSTLTVYETDRIKCQFKFKEKTFITKSTSTSSCALELKNGHVKLYILRNCDIDYFDVASELARFVLKNPKDSLFYQISDKLALPMEKLKQRGVPVDRLLKNVERQQPVRMEPRVINMYPKQQKLTQNNENETRSSPIDRHVVKSNTVIDRIEDFGPYFFNQLNNIQQVVQGVQTFINNELKQSQHKSIEETHSCTVNPEMNLVRVQEIFHSISLFIERKVTVTYQMMTRAEQLARLLNGLATKVFDIPVETMHLFRDIDGPKIAFNSNGAIFFNLRYYEQTFAKESSEVPDITQLINFYYLTTCHELSHNKYSIHDRKFVELMEMIIMKYMVEKDMFIKQFSFDYDSAYQSAQL